MVSVTVAWMLVPEGMVGVFSETEKSFSCMQSLDRSSEGSAGYGSGLLIGWSGV